MSTLAASNLDEPPPKINQPSLQSPSSFSSLPNDIVLDILARVPKRYYPILSCVSKNFQILVRSREIQKTRSILGKDSLYICFRDSYAGTHNNWYTLCRKEKTLTENLFVSIDFPFFPKSLYNSVIAVGPEIFFIGGFNGFSSSSLWIFDSRSRKYRQGPNMHVERNYSSTVGIVSGKMYVIGWDLHNNKNHAEFFDLKTQTWNQAPISDEKGSYTLTCTTNNFVLNRKVCGLNILGHITCYDTRDGSCERVECPNLKWCSTEVCVIDNVLYVYYYQLGLMWYDSKLVQWRIVNGLDHLKYDQNVGMAEYYGELAYVWTKMDGETKQIWCRMIALDKSELGIHGTAEPSQLLGTVPRDYILHKCLSLSG